MNNTDLQKIGQSIAFYRKNKGFTQGKFAKKLATSQSAIARIEKGEQNLTTEMISKINKVLGKNIISLASPMLDLKIEGGRELQGSVLVRSSKNSSVCLTYASLLNGGQTTIKNISPISEISRIVDLYKTIGVEAVEKNEDLRINLKQIVGSKFSLIDKLNSWPLLIGVISAYFDKFQLPVQQLEFKNLNAHLLSLEQLGFKFEIKDSTLFVDGTAKKGGEVVMYESGDTATLNVIFASLFCSGKTVIKNASLGSQVQDTCIFLKTLGYAIGDIKSLEIKVEGSSKVLSKTIEYEPVFDTNEALFYVASALVTKSEIEIKNFPIDFLQVELIKLKNMGMKYSISHSTSKNEFNVVDLTVYKSNLKALKEKLYSKSFPGIAVDNLPYFAAIACITEGRSEIYDFITEDRILSVNELKNLGADVLVSDNHRAYITGVAKLKGADIYCTLGAHPGNMILISMLGAKGASTLRNAYSLNLWYEGLFKNLNKLGAKIDVLYEI